MFENLTVFQTSSAMARHAAQSQALISQNVANSDTPGYVARELPPFSSLYTPTDAGGLQRSTRAGHLHGVSDGAELTANDVRSGNHPNQNTVSLESELLKSSEAKSQHDRALAIYKSALDVLRTAVRSR